MTQIHDLTVRELAAAIRARELSPVEITGHYLDRIEALNSDVGAFYTVTADAARDQAAEAEKAVARASDPGMLPPLTGVPIPIKDLNMVAGVRQTLGSLVYEDNVPAEDDHVSAALRAAGAVMPGKTATPEFGLPCYTETAIGPPARTPWDLSRSAGGSSGGAGAAVAAGLAPAAQGSDGGGSIRIPSSVCGLFGIKPTRGRISSAPLVPDLFGLGIDGPLARTVADAALLLDVMTGNQDGDMYTLPPLPAGESFLGHVRRDPGRLRIGRTLVHAVEGAEVHPDCVAAYEDASALLASLGHEVVDMEPPFTPDVVPAFEILWYAMATLAPVDPGKADRLLPLTRYLRERGTEVRAPELILAQAYLQFTVRAAWKIINGYDVVLTPTLAQPPVPVGYFDDCTHGVKGCTLCTRACPRFREWETEIDTFLFGRERAVDEVSGVAKDVVLARAADPQVHEQGQDGGLVSAILIWALENDVIDAALVSYLEGDGTTWKAKPGVARTREEVLAAAGSRYTYSANTLAYSDAIGAGAERIAMVGMSCMTSAPPVMAARKAGKVARRFALNIGLLCSKTFDDSIFEELFLAKYGLAKEDMVKMNIKGVFQIWMRNGDYHEIPLKECHAWTRDGCKSCPDFAAEHADISTGGIGAFNDWTLTVVRTDRGREVMDGLVRDGLIETRPADDDPGAVALMRKLSRVSRARWPETAVPAPRLMPPKTASV